MLLHERLQQVMEEKNLKQVDLANATGKSKVAALKWMSGENIPKSDSLKKIAALLEVSEDWLLTGRTPQLSGLMNVKTYREGSPLDPDEVEIDFYESLRVACGNGCVVEVLESEKSKLRIPRRVLDEAGVYRDSVFAAPAEDDSMKPKIDDGDIVYVDCRRNTIKNNRIFVIEHGGLYRCKRLFELPDGGVRIVSDNKEEYEEERLTAQQIIDQRFKIIGWVWKIDKIEKW